MPDVTSTVDQEVQAAPVAEVPAETPASPEVPVAASDAAPVADANQPVDAAVVAAPVVETPVAEAAPVADQAPAAAAPAAEPESVASVAEAAPAEEPVTTPVAETASDDEPPADGPAPADQPGTEPAEPTPDVPGDSSSGDGGGDAGGDFSADSEAGDLTPAPLDEGSGEVVAEPAASDPDPFRLPDNFFHQEAAPEQHSQGHHHRCGGCHSGVGLQLNESRLEVTAPGRRIVVSHLDGGRIVIEFEDVAQAPGVYPTVG